MRALVLSVFAATLVAGCGYRTKLRVVSAADLDDPTHTQVTNYLSAPLRPGSPSEQAPGPITRAALTDEAWIEKLDTNTVCFGILVRTASELDMPLSDWKIEVNGEEAWTDGEKVAVRDWSYTGERQVLVADAVVANAFGALTLVEPAEKTLRVYERTAHVCAPKPEGSKLLLELVLPMDDNRGSWGETFAWQLK
jgi:hypothetical protein